MESADASGDAWFSCATASKQAGCHGAAANQVSVCPCWNSGVLDGLRDTRPAVVAVHLIVIRNIMLNVAYYLCFTDRKPAVVHTGPIMMPGLL